MNEFVINLKEFILTVGPLGPIICCLLIVTESMLPIMPLFVFIGLNYIFFGSVIGFILSWFFTIVGCCISYYIFSDKVKTWFEKKLTKKETVKKFMGIFDRLTFPQLVVLIAVPFTPAFAVNIVAGLSKVSFKKFLGAILIGKIFLITFWGYIGTSLIDSVKDPIILLKIGIMLLIAYLVSKFISKRYKID